MIQGLDASAGKFMIALEGIRDRLDRATREISSGRRVSTASDDPAHVDEILTTRALLDRTAQIQITLGRAQAEVDTAEQSLRVAMDALDRASQAGLQGTTPAATAASRQALAFQVGAIMEQLVSISGTQAEGRYVFGGDEDRIAPYALDLTQPNGVRMRAGGVPASTRETMHPAGTTFSVARTARQIFDDPAPENNVFGAVNQLRAALETGGDIGAALDRVRTAREHLNSEIGIYGGFQTRVKEALNFAGQLEIRQKQVLSDLQDADVTSAILELNEAATHQQAALGAYGKLPRTTLFDFLG